MSPFAGLEDSPLDKPSQVNGKNSVQEVGTSSAWVFIVSLSFES